VTSPFGVVVLVEAVRSGVRLVWDPPRYRGPAIALAKVKQSPDAARQVLRRAAAFRTQLEAWRGSSRIGVPVLVLPEAPVPTIGQCISCGEPIAAQAWRCAVCLLAVELVLGLTPVGMDGRATAI
jgi:hypothetical protein